MTLEEAIRIFIDKYGKDRLEDCRYAFCVLSDLVKENRYERKVLGIYYEVSKCMDLISLFEGKGVIEARKELSQKYKTEFAGRYDWIAYRDAFNAFASNICPKEYAKVHGKKSAGENDDAKEGVTLVKSIALSSPKPKENPLAKPNPAPATPKKPRPLKQQTPAPTNVFSGTVKKVRIVNKDGGVCLVRGNGKNLSVLDHRKKPLPSSCISRVAGSIVINLSGFNGIHTIDFGEVKVKKIEIESCYGMIDFLFFTADEVECYSEYGGVYGHLSCHEAKLWTKYGNIDISLNAPSCDLRSEYGDVRLNLKYNINNDVYVRGLAANRDILIMTNNRKIKPNPTRLFHRTAKVGGTFYGGDGKAYRLFLNAPNGKCKVR